MSRPARKGRHTAVAVAAVLALAVATTAVQAATPIAASVDFDAVASGSVANSALGPLAGSVYFANPDIELDFDANGYTGTFHWVDATAIYGDVRVAASPYAVSGANVLTNDLAPIMLVFAAPVDLTSFSVQQDLSGYGNPQAGGTHLAFLDGTGHELAGQSVYYTQFGQPGLAIRTGGTVFDVSAVLLAGGTDYDDLQFTAVPSAVPEPAPAALWLGGLAACAAWTRRWARR